MGSIIVVLWSVMVDEWISWVVGICMMNLVINVRWIMEMWNSVMNVKILMWIGEGMLIMMVIMCMHITMEVMTIVESMSLIVVKIWVSVSVDCLMVIMSICGIVFKWSCVESILLRSSISVMSSVWVCWNQLFMCLMVSIVVREIGSFFTVWLSDSVGWK